jgi:hypothetical protein
MSDAKMRAELAQAFVSVKALRILVVSLSADVLKERSDPQGAVDRLRRLLETTVDRTPMEGVAGFSADQIKHGVLSEIERTCQALAELVALRTGSAPPPRGPTGGL